MTAQLSDFNVEEKETTHLLNVWFMIMSNSPIGAYLQASPVERAQFYGRLCREIDRRIPIPKDTPR